MMEDNIRKVYICMTGSLLYSRNWHIINQLYLNKKKKIFFQISVAHSQRLADKLPI